MTFTLLPRTVHRHAAKGRRSRIAVLLAIVLAGGSLVPPAQAQLQKIEQTIFGMDCAPCAHAMEQGLGSMEGVETVSVSLNDGLATIELREANEVAYRHIRKTISDGGFAAKAASLEARGMLRRQEGEWILETPAGEQFVLRPGEEASLDERGLRDLSSDRPVAVTGTIPASPEANGAPWPLRVEKVQPAA